MTRFENAGRALPAHRPDEPCGRPGAAVVDREEASAGATEGGALADPFGRRITYLRFAITENCNLRCTYCRPAEESGVASLPPALRRDEVVRLASLFVRLGVRKIRLTGGEPTLHPGLVGVVSDLAAIAAEPPLLALTTNGVLLPRLAAPLRAAGLSRVNISLDAASAEGFRKMTGRDRFDDVRRGLDAALAAGFQRVKLNAVILRGANEEEIVPLVELAHELPVDVRFIEYMPLAGNGWNQSGHLPADEIERRIGERWELVESGREADAGPARMLSIAGFVGRVGFISPLSLPFCNDCNRVRVTARGTLRLCLLGGGEVDLAGPMKQGAGDDELERLIRAGLAGKARRHSIVPSENVTPPCGAPMWAVGG